MECYKCEEKKLSTEFPLENVSPDCQHPPLICCKCIFTHGKIKCPHDDCSKKTSKERYDMFENYWKEKFKVFEDEFELDPSNAMSDIPTSVILTFLNGETKAFPYHPEKSIKEFKEEIQKECGYPVENQKLVFKNQILKEYEDNSRKLNQLKTYGIKENSCILFVKLLYAVQEKMKKVVFDLHWGYPSPREGAVSKRPFNVDFLDATCFGFSGKKIRGYVDFRSQMTSQMYGAVHSGDMMDHKNRIGHHIIKVDLLALPKDLTHLVFTLSAYHSPTIAMFKNPSLQFFEESKPNKPLCKTNIAVANHSEAVIMCSLVRQNRKWEVLETVRFSAGSAHDYQPLLQTIQELLDGIGL